MVGLQQSAPINFSRISIQYEDRVSCTIVQWIFYEKCSYIIPAEITVLSEVQCSFLPKLKTLFLCTLCTKPRDQVNSQMSFMLHCQFFGRQGVSMLISYHYVEYFMLVCGDHKKLSYYIPFDSRSNFPNFLCRIITKYDESLCSQKCIERVTHLLLLF